MLRMWRILGSIGRRLFYRYQNKVIPITDSELESVARFVVGNGKRPFSVVWAEGRAELIRLGARLDDKLDARLVDALDVQLALVRLPEKLDELHEATKRIGEAFDTKTPAKR